jgi:hypothetical protein
MMQLEEVRADLIARHCLMQSDQQRPDLIEHEVIEHDAPLSDRQSNLAKGQRGARNDFQHRERSSATAATASSDPSQRTKDDRTHPSCHQTCADEELEATGKQFLTRDR